MPQDSLALFLNDASRHPLLTAQEEILLGTEIQKYFGHPEPETLSPGIKRRAFRARERMVNANLRLVVSVAKKYKMRSNSLDMGDLVQEGCIGLQRGAEKFDPARGYKFSTYAFWWIKQAINRAVQMTSRSIRIPTTVLGLVTKFEWECSKFAAENGFQPSKELIAEGMDLPLDKLEAALALYRRCRVVSGDSPLPSGDGSILEMQADPSSEMEPELDRDLAVVALESLPKDQQELIQRVIFKGEALGSIGSELGLSREAVRTRKERALRRLRRQMSRHEVAA